MGRWGLLDMTENGVNKALTQKELLFAKLRYEGKLNNSEIVAEVGISDRTGDRWFKRPEIQAEIQRLGEADTARARAVLQRASVKAAEKLEKLAEHQTSDPPLAETGRKAACDILQGAKIIKQEPKSLTGTEENPFVLKLISHIPGL